MNSWYFSTTFDLVPINSFIHSSNDWQQSKNQWCSFLNPTVAVALTNQRCVLSPKIVMKLIKWLLRFTQFEKFKGSSILWNDHLLCDKYLKIKKISKSERLNLSKNIYIGSFFIMIDYNSFPSTNTANHMHTIHE